MPEAIRVAPWPDPVLDVIGHDPRSWYAETFWLPTLGPTALLLMRHLADRFENDPAGLELPVADTAAALGLGPRAGQHSPLMRSLGRLQQFELACRESDTQIAVRRTCRPCTAATSGACRLRCKRATRTGWRNRAPSRSTSHAAAPAASR